MPDAVDTSRLYADARAFLTELARNNTRDWFAENKSVYDSQLKRPAEKLMAEIATVLEAQAGMPVRRKLFRPHRDMRFTEDKTPFHIHLHVMWSLPDGRAWMFGLSPDYATAGAGMMQFDGPVLGAWREAVADAPGEDLQEMLAANGWRMDPPGLERVPAPYPPDHPRAALLRRKGLIVWRDNLDDGLQSDPIATLQEAFDEMAPLHDWLGQLV